MSSSTKFRNSIQTKSLNQLTKTLGEVADILAFQLEPPYTEIKRFKAQEEEDDRYFLRFQGTLRLPYQSLERPDEGLIFYVDFAGEAISDLPNPPIHELLYAASVTSLTIFGYGDRWPGEIVKSQRELLNGLEVHSSTVKEIRLDNLLVILDEYS
ncbi:MAG TPA: hypothetical protein VJZ32_00015 [Candidatus Bathyarchaeia archaeon]|nr:hypothetical protein [Candidatus Bathyarchaeia archaeon]